jgi:methyl-accepting chemotaxis protein
MDAAAKSIAAGVSELSDRLSQSDAAAANAVTEVAKLIASSRQIGEVADTVRDLSCQTNLLSINAAIEAALAGEAGKSFAVVAAEVRELARRSRASADNIAQLIQTIQHNVDSVGSRLAEISESVNQIALLPAAATDSAQQQASSAAAMNQTASQSRTLPTADGQVHGRCPWTVANCVRCRG